MSNIEYRAIGEIEALDEQRRIVELALTQRRIAAQGVEMGPLDIFANHTRRTAVGAYVGQELVGVGISRVNPDSPDSHSVVDVLAVSGNYRWQGIGSGLLHMLRFQTAVEEGPPLRIRSGDVREAPEFFAKAGIEVPPGTPDDILVPVPPLPTPEV